MQKTHRQQLFIVNNRNKAKELTMARMATTSYNIKVDKKMKIERLAIEASQKVGRTVKWTEIMEVLVDEFGKDAQAMIIHREQQQKQGL